MYPVDVQSRTVLVRDQQEMRRRAMSLPRRAQRVRFRNDRPAPTLRPAPQGH